MLHWLAGQRQPEGSTDPDATGFVEAPETPAPVFAVRAFKHAIFGTPQTTQTKPRRNSTTDNGRPRNADIRPPRPGMARPKSSNDAQLLGRQQQLGDVLEPLSSPTKGILLTPGTAAAKKKNVTFGDHVLDNEGKRPMKNGLPDDYPNRAANVDSGLGNGSDLEDDGIEKYRSRTKLTEAFEQVRDDSAKKRRSKTDRRAKKLLEDDIDIPAEFIEPKSEAGKYWKREYDVYRTNTQREVKKLITKQKAAKSFAQTKDEQCTDLTDELRHERKKVETLEVKIEELTALMKDLSEQLIASRKEAQDRTEDIVRLRRQSRKDSTRPESDDCGALLPLERTTTQPEGKGVVKMDTDPIQRPSEPYQSLVETEKHKMDLQTFRARVKPKSESKPATQTDDIWAQSFGSSCPVATRNTEKPAKVAISAKADDNGVHANALQALDVNILGSGRDVEHDVRPGSSSEQPRSPLDQQRTNAKSVKREEEPARLPPKPPVHASALQRATSADSKHIPESAVNESKPEDDWSLPIPNFSPLPPDCQPKALATSSRRAPGPSVAAASRPHEAPILRPAQPSISTKENVSPSPNTSSKPHTPSRELHTKPSAIWSSMNAPPASQRVSGGTARVTKDGREVTNDRLEAAKARIQARGRVAS